MKSPRRSLAIALVALSPLLLSGCEKPNPGVTVWSGTTSQFEQAVCWQADGAALTAKECAQDVLSAASAGKDIPVIEVAPGDTVGISVDPVVADAGWSVQIAGSTLASGLTDTYYRFTFPESVATGGTGYTMQITSAASGSTGTSGYWFFQLIPS